MAAFLELRSTPHVGYGLPGFLKHGLRRDGDRVRHPVHDHGDLPRDARFETRIRLVENDLKIKVAR